MLGRWPRPQFPPAPGAAASPLFPGRRACRCAGLPPAALYSARSGPAHGLCDDRARYAASGRSRPPKRETIVWLRRSCRPSHPSFRASASTVTCRLPSRQEPAPPDPLTSRKLVRRRGKSYGIARHKPTGMAYNMVCDQFQGCQHATPCNWPVSHSHCRCWNWRLLIKTGQAIGFWPTLAACSWRCTCGRRSFRGRALRCCAKHWKP